MQRDEKQEKEVAAIGGLSRNELAARWEKAYGCPPPKGINRTLLERSAAWHLQAARLGGLSAAARAVLRAGRKPTGQGRNHAGGSSRRRARDDGRAHGSTNECKAPGVGAAAPLPKGTRLMREWNGRMHVVDVTEEGILFDGKLYRSLTAVAKRITGTHWSGPKFFRL